MTVDLIPLDDARAERFARYLLTTSATYDDTLTADLGVLVYQKASAGES